MVARASFALSTDEWLRRRDAGRFIAFAPVRAFPRTGCPKKAPGPLYHRHPQNGRTAPRTIPLTVKPTAECRPAAPLSIFVIAWLHNNQCVRHARATSTRMHDESVDTSARNGPLGQQTPRQVNREDASRARHIADAQKAAIRLDAAATEGQAEPEAGLVCAPRCVNGRNMCSTSPGGRLRTYPPPRSVCDRRLRRRSIRLRCEAP
jgi:hypothetical protein